MKSLLFFVLLGLTQLNGQESKLNINIDERIETIYTIAFFNDYKLVNKHENVYKSTLRNQLSHLKEHKAVAIFDTLSKKYNFTYYRIVEWTLKHSLFPEFKENKTLADNYSIVPDNKLYLLSDFHAALKSFNNDPIFQNYLKAIKSLNKSMISKVKKSKTIDKLPKYLEAFYGNKLDSYNLILSPLVHQGGFNAELVNEKGLKEIYAVVGPNGEIDFEPHFNKDYLENDIILHEFGHSFVNPLMEKHEYEVNNLKEKYFTKQFMADAKRQGNSGWKYVFNEVLLRATTIKLTEQIFGNDKAKKLLKKEINNGYFMVENIVEILDEYTSNRDTYETFNTFYPVLLNRLG